MSSRSDTDPLAIELVGIEKRFGAVHANRDVNLRVAGGTIHGIVGENGAGKSTLMSILYGFYQADVGQLMVNGKTLSPQGPKDAIDAGIGMVHQHFMLVDNFSVLENVVLGAESSGMLRGTLENARGTLLELERDYGLDIDPEAIVGELPVGAQQRVEILKALYRGAQVLILDEPTGALTPQEADALFRILERLRDAGTTVLLITHKLREIMAITDNVSVMRRGEIVATHRTADTSESQLAEDMVGRTVLLEVDKSPATPGEPILEVNDLVVRDTRGVPRVNHVSFEVRAGEIVGIAGVSGNGQSELLEALAGIQAWESGDIRIAGDTLARSGHYDAAEMRKRHAAHVPEDRLRMGLVREFRAAESFILGYHGDDAYGGRWLLSKRGVRNACASGMQGFDVRPPDTGLRTSLFSGGNQQKLVLAREFGREPQLLLVGQPTRGVDIGAIEFIHKQIVSLRDAGVAVLLVSVELDEIMSLSDRILVMFDGRIVGDLNAADADERTLGLMMANAA